METVLQIIAAAMALIPKITAIASQAIEAHRTDDLEALRALRVRVEAATDLLAPGPSQPPAGG